MKKIVIMLLAAFLLCSCGSNKARKTVSPLPSCLEITTLSDCTVPAQFTSDDFRWMGGNLTMKVFSEDLYDAVEVSLLERGDTLVFGGDKIVVETVADEGGMLTINGGLEEGGAWLVAGDGGTYRACQWDDHSLYTEIGTAHLPLSEDFMIVDCGENPSCTISWTEVQRTGKARTCR